MSDGDGLFLEVVDKLLKDRFEVPTSTVKARHHAHNWYMILQICFGEKSLLALKAKDWVTHIDENEAAYDACFRCNKDFGAKLGGCINLAFYQFLSSCFNVTTPDKVNFAGISLHHKHVEIENLNLTGHRPSYLMATQDKSRIRDDPDDKPTNKKQQKTDKLQNERKDLGAVICNTNQIKGWNCNKVYKQVFTKNWIAETPAFNATCIITCNMWYAQGHCFENCDHKATHKSFPDDSFKQAYGKWIKEQHSAGIRPWQSEQVEDSISQVVSYNKLNTNSQTYLNHAHPTQPTTGFITLSDSVPRASTSRFITYDTV
jgi:hypothetical protein